MNGSGCSVNSLSWSDMVEQEQSSNSMYLVTVMPARYRNLRKGLPVYDVGCDELVKAYWAAVL